MLAVLNGPQCIFCLSGVNKLFSVFNFLIIFFSLFQSSAAFPFPQFQASIQFSLFSFLLQLCGFYFFFFLTSFFHILFCISFFAMSPSAYPLSYIVILPCFEIHTFPSRFPSFSEFNLLLWFLPFLGISPFLLVLFPLNIHLFFILCS